jgi:hypothetical protein
MTFYPPSPEQVNFVRLMQKKLRIPNKLLDNLCVDRFNDEFAKLSGRQCSQLFDEMKTWKAATADMLREMGQIDLPGLGL